MTVRSGGGRRRTFQAHLRAVKEAPPWAWLLRILVIALFERFRPRLAARLELFCIGIPLCDGLGALLVSAFAISEGCEGDGIERYTHL